MTAAVRPTDCTGDTSCARSSPTSRPGLTPRPHAPASRPGLTPRPHAPASRPGLTPRPHAPARPALLCLCLLALTAPAAHAGTWALDHYTQSGSDKYQSVERRPSTRTWSAANIPPGGPVTHGGDYVDYEQYTFTSAGTITAVFVWQPAFSGDPPTTFIVGTTTIASGYADGAGAVTYTLDDGQGDQQQPDGDGAISQGTLYTVEPGGQSTVSVPITISAAASDATGTPDCTASVSVQATAYNVTIQLVGAPATTDGTKTGPPEALAGEQITATVVGLPPGYTISSETWSTTGGSPFENYNTALTSNQQVPLSAADMAAQNFSFYDADNDTVYVKCAVVIQPPTPAGGTAPPTVSVTATSQPVAFVKPAFDTWTVNHGYVQKTAGYIMQLAATKAVPNGEDWSGVTMTFPTSIPNYLVGNYGCFAQLDTPDYTYTPAPANPDPLNGIQGLDTSFPLQDASGHVAKWGVTGTPGSPTAPSPDDGDSPGIGGGSGNTTKIVASEAFTTWVMYQPGAYAPQGGPTQGVIWVPIASYPWNWGGTATLVNNIWGLTATTPTSAGAGPKPSATTTYPTWTCVHTD